MKHHVGDRIRIAREHRRLSQFDLSIASGIAQSAISLLETSGAGMHPGHYDRIARSLNVPVEWLHYGVVGEVADFETAALSKYVRRT